MSARSEPESAKGTAADPAAGSRWAWIEKFLARLGDRLNPILVKEARQALKSRQFVITFALLLICGWLWSILGLGFGPGVGYTPMGGRMFIGYYLILAFPLVVIVPFGAFRALAVEQEDRTYELLSITALDPRQIIVGKLGSTVAQMLIYLSAISPCLAFTYLLRGIDIVTIVFGLVYVVLFSLGASMVGLAVGTLTSERHWQVLLSIGMIVGLLMSFAYSSVGAVALIEMGLPVDDVEFWLLAAAIATAYVSYFALFFYAAVARITFASENRSTRLRAVMVVQHILFTAWVSVGLMISPDSTGLYVYLSGTLIHWGVMGAFMTGESPQLSLRVRRRLPQSLLGRMLFTWFNPGPATGYVFAICGGIAAVILVAMAVAFTDWPQLAGRTAWRGGRARSLLAFGVLGVSYLVLYLGVGLLVLRGLRRLGQSGMLLTVLMHVLLVMLGCGLPVVLDMALSNSPRVSYSYLQLPNFVWTLAEFADPMPPAEAPFLLIVLPIAAISVLLLNCPGIVRELLYVRIAEPSRVAEEDAEIAARLHPPRLVQVSPWDVELK